MLSKAFLKVYTPKNTGLLVVDLYEKRTKEILLCKRTETSNRRIFPLVWH